MKLNYQFNNEPWQYGLVSNEEAPIEDRELNKSDILKELSSDEEESEELEEEIIKDTEEESEEDDEELDIKEEDEEEEEEKLEEEELELQVPVKIKEVLAKYPNFKKEFPSVVALYFKAREYSEILPTIEDAKEAADSHKILQNFRGDLEKGDISRVLTAVKSQAPEEYPALIDNYLLTLAKIDKEAYDHVTYNVMANTLQFVYKKAKESGAEDLQEAVEIFNNYLFESKEIVRPVRISREKRDDDESSRLKKEREEYENQKAKDAFDEVDSRTDSQIKSTIELNIDKKSQMTPFVKRNAIRTVQEKLKEALESDKTFKKYEESLRNRAKADKYSRTALDRIKSARLTQAKNLLPKIIAQVKAEALKGSTRREDTKTRFRRATSSERETSGDRGSNNRKFNGRDGYDDKGKKIRTIDFLSS